MCYSAIRISRALRCIYAAIHPMTLPRSHAPFNMHSAALLAIVGWLAIGACVAAPVPDTDSTISTFNASNCVDLNSGYAFKDNDINSWPCVKVSRGAGTLNHIPRLGNILGKTWKVTVDISKVGCRNVLAFQMVDSLHNGGNYCDGQSPDPCVEIDFMEANEHVWGSTIHAGDVPGGWKGGSAKGYGGNRQGLWNYGVDQANVNTRYPIDVNFGFPTDGNGNLKYILVAMFQFGNTSPKAVFTLDGINLQETSDAIRRGMLPGFSYWNTDVNGVDWYDKNQCNYWYPGAPAYFSNWQLVDSAMTLETLQPRV